MAGLKRNNKSLENQIERVVEDLIDSDISPALKAHDGSCSLLSILLKDQTLLVLISYSGSCASCGTSIKETLTYIKNYVQEELVLKDLFHGEVNVITTEDFKEAAGAFKEYPFLDLE